MAIARGGMNAVRLGDGRVLVVGNGAYDVTADSAKAELWDPATGAWHTTEGLNSPRTDFVAVPLADGRALIAGGRNKDDQSYSSTYVFDPRTETWSKVGLLGKARTSPVAAVLSDGRVLAAGGYFRVKPSFGAVDPGTVLAAYHPDRPANEIVGPRLADIEPPNVGAALATAELFDPATGAWSATGPMKFARFDAEAVTLTDGRILVFGSGDSSSGVTVDDRAADTAEIFDPATGRFSLVGALPAINRKELQKAGVSGANPVPDDDPMVAAVGTLVALDDGGAVLIAHAGWWKHVGEITRSFRFDGGSGDWHEIGQTYVFIGEPTAVSLVTREIPSLAGALVDQLPGGRVLVAGGAGGIPKDYQYSNTFTTAAAQAYNPATDTWSALPPMPDPRAGGATVTLADGSILMIGGYVVSPPDGDQADIASAVRFLPGD